MGLELVQRGSILSGRYEVRAALRSEPDVRAWEAYDPVLDRDVVVETLDPRCTGEVRTAFLASALRAARCSAHGVLKVFDTGNEKGTAYVVRELVRGTSLDELVITRGPLPVDEAANIICEASDALGGAHRDQLFHGTLHASSVIVTETTRVKIGGFGGPTIDDRYRAPELAGTPFATELGDVYAMGVCAVEILTGTPFDPRAQSVADALAQRGDVPDAVRLTLERALDPDPTTRAAHVRALHRACAPFRSDHASAPSSAAIGAPLPPDVASTLATESVPVVTVEPTTVQPVTPGAPPSAPNMAASAGLEPGPRPRRLRSTLTLLAALIGVGFLIGVVGVVLLTRSRDTAPSRPAPAAVPVPIASVQDYDPFGDNRQEGRANVANVIDGGPDTAWSTEIYSSPTFGNTKPGLGLRARLTQPTRVRDVVIASLAPGWDASVYLGDGRAQALADWGTPAGTTTDASTRATIPVNRAEPASEVLIWFTKLPSSGRLDVTEVQVLG